MTTTSGQSADKTLSPGSGSATDGGYRLPPGFQRGDVDTGEVRLTYWRRGQGRPLLVLHGVTDWGLDWSRFAARIDDALDCVLLDQRGHGYSDKPVSEDGYTYTRLAEDAWQVIRRLGLAQPAVLGHSMGGGVALALAAAHPEAIDRLILVDPATRFHVEPPEGASPGAETARRDPQAARQQLRERQALGRGRLVADLRAARPSWHPDDVTNTVESTLLASPYVRTAARWFDPAAQEGQLRRVRCPVLLVRGQPALGGIVSDAQAQRFREIVGDERGRVVTIAGTGHVPQREAFDLFVTLVRPFLTGETVPPAEGGAPACFLHLLNEEGR